MKKILMLFIIAFLVSCSAKKKITETTIDKEETILDSNSHTIHTKPSEEIILESSMEIGNESLVITAADTTKQMEIIDSSGKVTKYKNVIIRSESSNEKTVDKKTEKKGEEVDVSFTQNTTTTTVVKAKISAPEGKKISWYWWLLLVIASGYIYYKYKKHIETDV